MGALTTAVFLSATLSETMPNALLPFESDDEVIFRIPAVDDFTHSWTDILLLIFSALRVERETPKSISEHPCSC